MSLNLTEADEIPVAGGYCPGCGRSPGGELHDCVGRLSLGPVPETCPECGRPSTRVRMPELERRVVRGSYRHGDQKVADCLRGFN